MSERKVLNKFYPNNFDASKIPRTKKNRQYTYTVRLMTPFNLRCNCGEYIYRGKKFNARKEDVTGQDYLGIRIYRFFIKCTRCMQEIAFKTNPKNTNYELEEGATRDFMSLKREEEQLKEEEEEEANNRWKMLESRSKQTRIEIEDREKLEEIKDRNRIVTLIDINSLLKEYSNTASATEKKRTEVDEEIAKKLFAKKNKTVNYKIVDYEIVDVDDEKKIIENK